MQTTAGQLFNVLEDMFNSGEVDEDTPVTIRVKPKEPNPHTDAPTQHALGDVWATLTADGYHVMLDEVGV